MSKKVLAVLVLIICVVLIIKLSKKDGSSSPLSPSSGKITVNNDGTFKGQYSIQDIMSLKKPYECTFTKSDGSSSVSGGVKTDGQKVRADIDIGFSGEESGNFTSHFIVKDDTNYVWTSLQAIGYKSSTVSSANKNSSPSSQAQIVGLKDKIAYDCKPWNANLNVFELPTGVSFTELK